MKEDHQKALKKVNFFFLSNPVPFNGCNYQKQKGSGTSDQLLFRLQNKFKILFYLLYIIWQSLMMYCKAVIELFQKLHMQIYASQLMTS